MFMELIAIAPHCNSKYILRRGIKLGFSLLHYGYLEKYKRQTPPLVMMTNVACNISYFHQSEVPLFSTYYIGQYFRSQGLATNGSVTVIGLYAP